MHLTQDARCHCWLKMCINIYHRTDCGLTVPLTSWSFSPDRTERVQNVLTRRKWHLWPFQQGKERASWRCCWSKQRLNTSREVSVFTHSGGTGLGFRRSSRPKILFACVIALFFVPTSLTGEGKVYLTCLNDRCPVVLENYSSKTSLYLLLFLCIICISQENF